MGLYSLQRVEEALGPAKDRSGHDYDFDCPFCSGGTLHVNPYKVNEGSSGKTYGAAICHQCGYATRDLHKMLRRLGVTTLSTPSTEFVGTLDELGALIHGRHDDLSMSSECGLPDEYSPIHGNTSSIATVFRRYLKSRGVTDRQIRRHAIGFCTEGRYSGYLIIPVHDPYDGRVVYFTNRRVVGMRNGPKVLNPKGVSIGEHVFNLRGAVEKGWGVITEAPFDAMAFGDKGVATMGDHVTDRQLSLMRQSGVKEWTVAFDSLAIRSAYRSAFRLSQSVDADVTVLHLPTRIPKRKTRIPAHRMTLPRLLRKIDQLVERYADEPDHDAPYTALKRLLGDNVVETDPNDYTRKQLRKMLTHRRPFKLTRAVERLIARHP